MLFNLWAQMILPGNMLIGSKLTEQNVAVLSISLLLKLAKTNSVECFNPSAPNGNQQELNVGKCVTSGRFYLEEIQ